MNLFHPLAPRLKLRTGAERPGRLFARKRRMKLGAVQRLPNGGRGRYSQVARFGREGGLGDSGRGLRGGAFSVEGFHELSHPTAPRTGRHDVLRGSLPGYFCSADIWERQERTRLKVAPQKTCQTYPNRPPRPNVWRR